MAARGSLSSHHSTCSTSALINCSIKAKCFALKGPSTLGYPLASFLEDSGLGFGVFVKLPQLAPSWSPFRPLPRTTCGSHQPQSRCFLPIPQLFRFRIQTLFFLVCKFLSFFTKSILLNTNGIKILFSTQIIHKHFRSPPPAAPMFPIRFSLIQPLPEHVYFSLHMFHPCVKC